jgi:DNA uptake protein ComE-like DNA-binding protein
MTICKDTRTGQLVEFLSHHDVNFAMVKRNDGHVYYPQLSHLVFFEPGVGASEEGPQPQKTEAQVAEENAPASLIPVDTRMNLNAATSDQMVALNGIGYATAKKIVELRNSLTGERFSNLDQLRSIERVNWDEVFKLDQFYV